MSGGRGHEGVPSFYVMTVLPSALLCLTSSHLFLTCDDHRARILWLTLRCSSVLLTYLCAALKSLLDSPHADLGCWLL